MVRIKKVLGSRGGGGQEGRGGWVRSPGVVGLRGGGLG